ncbi:hypothetical protein D3C75_998790 [compost metagenome]
MLAALLALAIEHRLQGRNLQLLVAADVAEFASEGGLAKRPVQGAGQVVALALEVVALAFEFQTEDAAPATTAGVGFVHSIKLQRPQRLEVVQAMALEQREFRAGQVIGHSLPSKKPSTR